MEIINGKTRPADIKAFKKYADYLMYKCVINGKPAAEMSFEEMHEEQAGWDINSMIRGASRLAELAETQESLYSVYLPEECIDDPEKKDVKVWFMPARQPSDKPFIIEIAGGAYTCVCSLIEAFPTAARFNELGYPVFVLNYRVLQKELMPKPVDDLAAAVRFILKNKETFGLKCEDYVVNGFSAGANLTAIWGTELKGYAKYGLPCPKAIFPVYPCISSEYQYAQSKTWFIKTMFGEGYDVGTVKEYDIPNIFTGRYPAAYIVHAKDDLIVPAENSIQLKSLLDKKNINVRLELVEKGGHGFGDGSGTDADGWPNRAVRFLETL